jgi:hypothetical protein
MKTYNQNKKSNISKFVPINEIIKNFNADKNFYDVSIPKYANLVLKQLEYLQNRIVW